MPLSADELAEHLKLASSEWNLDYGQQTSTTGGGTLLAADVRDALWRAVITTGELDDDDLHAVYARFLRLQGSIGTFYMHNFRRLRPRNHDGESLDSVAVKSVDSEDLTVIALKGLPADFALSTGDALSIEHGSRPNVGYHLIAEDVEADGAGETALFKIQPARQSSVSADDEVTLLKPVAEMKILPGTLRVRQHSGLYSTIQAEAMQYIE